MIYYGIYFYGTFVATIPSRSLCKSWVEWGIVQGYDAVCVMYTAV